MHDHLLTCEMKVPGLEMSMLNGPLVATAVGVGPNVGATLGVSVGAGVGEPVGPEPSVAVAARASVVGLAAGPRAATVPTATQAADASITHTAA
jgi:hypothetical protein